ncbi:MAG TPA: hypothetical protein VGL81_26240 [Polyangiaceae bacterium]|jgi:hypothetical protein
MTTKNKTNVQTQQAADQALIDGFTKHEATIPSLIIAGTSVPTPTIISTLQKRIAARAAVAPAKASYQGLVKADQDERASTKAFVSGAKQAVQVMFTGQIETLGDFGLKPRKAPTPLTPEQRVAKAAKAKATRAANHPKAATAPVASPATPEVAPAATPATGVTKS